MQAPPVDRCRVLEMGCGEGANLIPLAYIFPNSTFLGVDLSKNAIEIGVAAVKKLGLTNVQLVAQDLMEFPRDAGTFDYILAHGILSWVPLEVREQMLEICARHLAPKGVAYISYNTLPGGYLRKYVRDLMRFHTRHIGDPDAKIRESRNVADFMVAAIPAPTIERELIKREMRPYEDRDSFLYHDLIAEINDPIYFLDFMDAAGRCAMQFVSESMMSTSSTSHLAPHIREQLETMTERLVREQYLDFINGRQFRQTVLCRAGHELDLKVTPERMERLLISTTAKPVKPIEDLFAQEKVEFRGPQTLPFTCNEAGPKAMFMALSDAFPASMRYSELRAEVCRRLGKGESELLPADDEHMIGTLVSAFMNDAVQFHVHDFAFCRTVGKCPVASPVARHQAANEASVTSLRLSSFNMQDPFFRELILLLDGTRDVQRIVIDLSAKLHSPGAVSVETVERALELLAANAVLEA